MCMAIMQLYQQYYTLIKKLLDKCKLNERSMSPFLPKITLFSIGIEALGPGFCCKLPNVEGPCNSLLFDCLTQISLDFVQIPRSDYTQNGMENRLILVPQFKY